jgi:ABC-type nickel/cobalt efflux system permease component RcnA
MAIAALSVVPPGAGSAARTHPVRVAFGFAVGHALLLLVGSAVVVLLGWQIPALVERAGELAGGVLLVGLGAFSLWVALDQRLYGHTHVHGDPPHTHWHVHFGHPHRHRSDGHSHVPGLLGAVFAVSGLRALTMLAPFGGHMAGSVAASMLTLLYLIAIFAIGILLAMSLFGVVLSRVLGSGVVTRTISYGAAVATAIASIGLGMYWIAVNL